MYTVHAYIWAIGVYGDVCLGKFTNKTYNKINCFMYENIYNTHTNVCFRHMYVCNAVVLNLSREIFKRKHYIH